MAVSTENWSAWAAWTFPIALALVAGGAVLVVDWALDFQSVAVGEPLSARTAWAIAALLFMMFFSFSLVACNVVMFRCGRPYHAFLGFVVTTVLGIAATIYWISNRYVYLGPSAMKDYLDATAFCVGHVRLLTAAMDGLATWSALLVVTTSAVILANELDPRDSDSPQELSRQLRGTKILMYAAAALLITGVSEVAALHRWPASESAAYLPSCSNVTAAQMLGTESARATIDKAAVAISTSIGTIGSLVLAAAYLPLAILLRQRAYRVIDHWERTETWLAIHGFALQPTQQLAKILLILSPLLAGGPMNYLISLLSN